MEKEISVDAVVEYITTPPYHNITETGQYFGVSRAVVSNHLRELTDETSLYYNEMRAKRVMIVLDELLTNARSKAGAKKRGKVLINRNMALALRYSQLYNGVSLRELAKIFSFSHMTIYNAIKALSPEDCAMQDKIVRQNYEALTQEEKNMLDEWNNHESEIERLCPKR